MMMFIQNQCIRNRIPDMEDNNILGKIALTFLEGN